MTRPEPTPRRPLGRDLEHALQDWIAASRRAWNPGRDLRDEQAEDAAWDRVKHVLTSEDAATAA